MEFLQLTFENDNFNFWNTAPQRKTANHIHWNKI